jgi:hypothetical protein
LNVIDFGKNTFQCEITFKFDCLSPDFFVNVAQSMQPPTPWHFGKDQQYSLIVTTGDGSETVPFFQVKFASDKIAMWCGWHVSYDSWKQWRTEVIANLTALSSNFPSQFVSHFVTQASITVPLARLKRAPGDLPELKPIFDFYRRYVPEPFLSKGASHGVFANEDSTQFIETQVTGNQLENVFNFACRWTSVDPRVSIAQGLNNHFSFFDGLFEKWHNTLLLSLVTESGDTKTAVIR